MASARGDFTTIPALHVESLKTAFFGRFGIFRMNQTTVAAPSGPKPEPKIKYARLGRNLTYRERAGPQRWGLADVAVGSFPRFEGRSHHYPFSPNTESVWTSVDAPETRRLQDSDLSNLYQSSRN